MTETFRSRRRTEGFRFRNKRIVEERGMEGLRSRRGTVVEERGMEEFRDSCGGKRDGWNTTSKSTIDCRAGALLDLGDPLLFIWL